VAPDGTSTLVALTNTRIIRGDITES
jgi:hypothetical protein